MSGKSNLPVLGLFLMAILCAGEASADFRFPFTNPVRKILVVPSSIDPHQLYPFRNVKHLSIRVEMVGGNLLPGRLVRLFESQFSGVPLSFVFRGDVEPRHAEVIRPLRPHEVIYVADRGFDRHIANRLYDFGPAGRRVVLPVDFTRRMVLDAFKVNGGSVELAPSGRFSEQQMQWLGEDRRRKKHVVISGADAAEIIYQALELSPLHLVVRTRRNRLAPEVLDLLRRLRGVEITIAVDGKLTGQDAEPLAKLENFSLMVELGDPPDFIPGLAELLDRINPP